MTETTQHKKRSGLKIAVGAVLALVLVAVIGWFTLVMWIPDVVSGNPGTVSAISHEDGTRIALWQIWGPNRDFYETYVSVARPGESTETFMLDPDGPKLWRCRMKYDGGAVKIENFILGTREIWIGDGFADDGAVREPKGALPIELAPDLATKVDDLIRVDN